jgi:hypothetical protein
MSSRRSRGDGGLHWDQRRQRWVATMTVGYDGRGKRLVRHGYGRTKIEARRSCATSSAAAKMVWSSRGTATRCVRQLRTGLSTASVAATRRHVTRTVICARSTCFRTSGHGSCGI